VATKAKIIKLTDLSRAVDKAVAANAGKAKLPGGLIMGRYLTKAMAANVDVNALAKSVTKELAPSLTDFRLTPRVIIGDDIITCGFLAREISGIG
jgi:hypothetical protein